MSQSETPLTFGIGQALGADTLEVMWPAGKMTIHLSVKAGQTITISPEGIVSEERFVDSQ